MTLTPEQLEWIVSEVVRRLRLEFSESVEVEPSLTLDDRLITLASLRGRLAGVRQLLVTKKAVVTPAVRDELKKHGIKLVRNESDANCQN